MNRKIVGIFFCLLGCLLPLKTYALSIVANGPFGGNIRALAVDRVNPYILYGATAEGVYKSTDSAGQWSSIGSLLSGKTIHALTVIRGSIYVGTSSGIYRSSDSGITWVALNDGLESYDILCITEIGPSLYAGTSKGMYKSLDDGLTWLSVDGMQGFSILTIVCDPNNLSIQFAGTSKGIFKSQDAGVNWVEINSGINPSDKYIQCIVVDAARQIIYIGASGGRGAFKSADGGNSWVPITTGLPTNVIWDAVLSNDCLFIATYDGVYKSQDQGETWLLLDMGLTTSSVKTLVSDNSGSLYAGTMRSGILKSTDLENNWHEVNAGLTGVKISSLIVDTANNIHVAAKEGAYVISDAGTTWQRTAINDAQVVLYNKSSSKYYLAAKGLYVSDDGHSWQLTDGSDFWIQALAVAEGTSETLYAGTYNGIYVSNDQGHTWTKLSGETLSSVLSIALVPDAPATIFAGTMNGMYWSADGGESWSLLNLGDSLIVPFGKMPVSGVTLLVEPPSTVLPAHSITLTAQASGGIGNYEYYFTWYSSNTGKWSVGQAYSNANSWIWDTTGLQPGNYSIQVWSRNAGSAARYETYASRSLALTLSPPPASSVSVSTDRISPQPVGSKVTYTATVSGGSGSYEYYFTWYNPNTSKWSVGQAYSNTNSWMWNTTGLQPGNYSIQVWSRNTGSTARYETYASRTLALTLPPPSASAVVVSTDRNSPQSAGSKVTYTATASGGSGSYEYYFTWYNPNTRKWSVGQVYSNTNIWTWDTRGLQPGNYSIQVWSRNAGSAARYETYANRTLALSLPPPASAVVVSTDRNSPQSAGSKVTFTAQASGGSGSYEYYFTLYNHQAAKWTAEQAYSTKNSWTWDTTKVVPGGYTLEIWVRNAGAQSNYDVTNRVSYTVL